MKDELAKTIKSIKEGENDYSEALWATSPDFESHPSGRWEPLQIACFAECRLLDEVSLVKAANAPLDAARPWQDLPHQVHDNQAKSRWLYATGTLASNWRFFRNYP